MPDLDKFLCNSLLGWLVIQVILTLVYLLSLYSNQKNLLPDDQLPKTAVILCLRGADPYLRQCLRALLQQNYPQYELKIVVDHQDDPAWNVAVDTVQALGVTNVEISPLRNVRNNCSLKCSSLVQAVSELDDSYKVVALVDSHSVVHPNWLRELVNPLAHPKVGATSGSCWYLPRGKYWWSLVPYISNVSLVIQKYLFGMPWGGSLAIKTEVIQQTGLLNKWSLALCEDILIGSVLRKHKLRVKFVPSLFMVNREESDLSGLKNQIQRQVIASRLYHPQPSAIIGDTISSIIIPTLVLMSLIWTSFTGQWENFKMLLGCYVSYTVGLLWLMLILEHGVQQMTRDRLQPIVPITFTTIFKLLIGIPLTQWIYGLGLLSTLGMTTITWRGINYRIFSAWNVRLEEYKPFRRS
ncbi:MULTISPECIES: glycosyltransferase [Calothrix]|uniref:Glycosyltransferase family 2 protein n=2 Tax=Calothrix TaxID=1186 RepID=A0ABR8AE62_9CYAN|nr:MULTISPECIES: glycosyltransferase family 2 protein [Calothrix]MBD2198209.1 glycosyltransferase family 2 protein [Calothrix parietina FACHB-288]MBD2226563.1 glycosyltransferase family 2 protein [Calothrix anomala FACHB-343]